MNATLSVNNRTKDKTKTSNVTGIRIIRIAAFAFAIVSWKATASGLSEYVFGPGWQSLLISFAIQAILFVFNLKLPFYFHRIGEKTPNREKKKYHFGAKKGIEKEAYKTTTLQKVIIGFYIVVLCCSSFFSFVYICNYVVYEHQSGYVDDNVILASSYREILNDTDDYIAENKKVMRILVREIIGELQEKYPVDDSSKDNPVSKQDLEDAVNKAQDAYDIAKEEYEIAKDDANSFKEEMDSYADSRNGTAWHDRQDEWEEKYEAAKEDWGTAVEDRGGKKDAYETAKKELTRTKNALKNYKDSQKTIIAEILSELLKEDQHGDELEKHISELNKTITALGTDGDIVDNYDQLVETTQALTVVVEDYISLVRVTSDDDTDDETSIKYMMEHVMDDIVIPDPALESFENDYSSWRNTWDSKLSDLENLIQKLPLPRFLEKKSEGSGDTIINVELLEEYDANEKINTLDELRRSKISDINVIEKATFLLFGRYWFTAWFSLGFAFFLDISSLLAGLFIYGIRKKKSAA